MKNKEQMGKGFNRMLPDLTAYVIGELKKVWGDQWWSELYNRLYDDQKNSIQKMDRKKKYSNISILLFV